MNNKKIINILITEIINDIFVDIEKDYILLNEDWSWQDNLISPGMSSLSKTMTFLSDSALWLLSFVENDINVSFGEKTIGVSTILGVIENFIPYRLGSAGLTSVSGLGYIVGGLYLIAGSSGFEEDAKMFYKISGFLYCVMGMILLLGGANALFAALGKANLDDANLTAIVTDLTISISDAFKDTALTKSEVQSLINEAIKLTKTKNNLLPKDFGAKILGSGGDAEIVFTIGNKIVFKEKNGKNVILIKNNNNNQLLKDSIGLDNDLEPSPAGSPQNKKSILKIDEIEDDVIDDLSNAIEIDLSEVVLDDVSMHDQLTSAFMTESIIIDSTINLTSNKKITGQIREKIQKTGKVVDNLLINLRGNTSSLTKEEISSIVKEYLEGLNMISPENTKKLTNFLEGNSRSQIIDAFEDLNNNIKKMSSPDAGVVPQRENNTTGLVSINTDKLGNSSGKSALKALDAEDGKSAGIRGTRWAFNIFKAQRYKARIGYLSELAERLKAMQTKLKNRIAAKPININVNIVDGNSNKIVTNAIVTFDDIIVPGIFVGKISQKEAIVSLQQEIATLKKEVESKNAVLRTQIPSVTFDNNGYAIVSKGVQVRPEGTNALDDYTTSVKALNAKNARMKMLSEMEENSTFLFEMSGDKNLKDFITGNLNQDELNDFIFARTWFSETAPGDHNSYNFWNIVYQTVKNNQILIRVAAIPIASRLFTDPEGVAGMGWDMEWGESKDDFNNASTGTPTIYYHNEGIDQLNKVSKKEGWDDLFKAMEQDETSRRPPEED